jgi:tRNA G10  N-methylase Trm11
MTKSELVHPGHSEPSFELLAETFISQCTAPGELVLDPFAGYGTTISVARRLGRRGLGVEIVPELAAGIRERLGPDAVVEGDTRALSELGLPKVDMVMTSPPFMTRTDHDQNPLSGYQTLDGDYERYIPEVAGIVAGLNALVRPGGRIVLDVWNFHHEGQFTPLARDVEEALDGVVPLLRRVRIQWPDCAWEIEDICLVYRAG